MRRSAAPAWLALALGLITTGAAHAMSLPDAIALARKSNPTLAQRQDELAAAQARVAQANAGRMPTVTLVGQVGVGSADLGGFFGIGRSTIHPEQATVEVRQPLFAGGAINAAIDRARAARAAAREDVAASRAELTTGVADAYVAVVDARERVHLIDAEAVQVQTFVDQARQRFRSGEVPRTDLSEAEARLAELRAGQAEAQANVTRAEAHFQSVVGQAADQLDPPKAPALTVASLDEATAAAERGNPALLSAQANLQAADAAVRGAEAGRYPTLALTGNAGTVRDQFFPGYRNTGYAVGIEGRWTLFSGGLVSGQIDEARANRAAAEAGLRAARDKVRDAVVSAWQDVLVAQSLVQAARDQAEAAGQALDSVTQEVRVGQKGMLDLLTAERESLAARSTLISAQGNAVVAAYRLNSLVDTAP